MKQIKLGKKDLYTIVDDNIYEKVKHIKWVLFTNKRNGYQYARGKVGNRAVYMHRFIFDLINAEDKKIHIDHINMNTLDNRLVNLRLTNAQGNAMNRGKQKNNTSGYKGVFYRKDSGKYRACIRYNQKLYHLGTYWDAIDAAKAYDKAAKIYFGEFAVLNFKEYNV